MAYDWRYSGGRLGRQPWQHPDVSDKGQDGDGRQTAEHRSCSALSAIHPSVAMGDRPQKLIQRGQIAHGAECTVAEMQPTRCAPQPLVDSYFIKRYAPVDILAAQHQNAAFGLQGDHPNERRVTVEIICGQHPATRVYNEISKSKAVAASSPAAPMLSGSA